MRLPSGAVMEFSHTVELDMFSWEWPTTFTFSFTDVQGRLHIHSQSCLGDNLQFRRSSNIKRLSGFEHQPLAYQFEAKNNHIPKPVSNNAYELCNTGS
jgi:hypothetical protein